MLNLLERPSVVLKMASVLLRIWESHTVAVATSSVGWILVCLLTNKSVTVTILIQ